MTRRKAKPTRERTPLEMVAFAAWIGVPPDHVPETYRLHTCVHTQRAWKRVVDAVVAAVVEVRP